MQVEWTPEPVSKHEAGTPVNPQFHTIWGVIRDGRIFMVRFSNVGAINVSILNPGGTPIA
jgi:hypothetical protein